MTRRDLLGGTVGLGGALAVGPAPAAEGLNVVVTGGHPGDPEYGCGGTIARYTDLGHEVVAALPERRRAGRGKPKGGVPRRRGGEGVRDPQGPAALRGAGRRRGGGRPGALRGVPQDPGGRAARRGLHPLADRQPRRPSGHVDAGLRRLAADGEGGSPSITTRSRTARTPSSSPRRITSTSRDGRAPEAAGLLSPTPASRPRSSTPCRSRSPGCAGSSGASATRRRSSATSATSRPPVA